MTFQFLNKSDFCQLFHDRRTLYVCDKFKFLICLEIFLTMMFQLLTICLNTSLKEIFILTEYIVHKI